MQNVQLLLQTPVLNVQLLLEGLFIGAVFALAACGLALVWSVMNIVNVAQGEFVMLGGFVALVVAWTGAPPLLGIPVAAIVLFAFGWAVYRLVLWRVGAGDMSTSVLATFGLAFLLQQFMHALFGADVRTVESGLGTFFLFDGLVMVAQVKVAALVLAVGGVLALWSFSKLFRLEVGARATGRLGGMARTGKADTRRVHALVFAANAALCGVAGALVIMAWSIHPFMGLLYTLRSFVIVLLVGGGGPPSMLGAGVGLGVVEQFAGFALGNEFQLAFVLLLLLVVMAWRRLLMTRQRQCPR